MPKSEVYNMDCLEAMRKMPDNAFDLTVADPPYGINITGRHRERERAGHGRRSREAVRRFAEATAEGDLRCRGGRLAQIQGQAKSSKSIQNFTQCSMMAPHRTQRCLGSCNG